MTIGQETALLVVANLLTMLLVFMPAIRNWVIKRREARYRRRQSIYPATKSYWMKSGNKCNVGDLVFEGMIERRWYVVAWWRVRLRVRWSILRLRRLMTWRKPRSNEPPWWDATPPSHPACRCTLIELDEKHEPTTTTGRNGATS